MKKLMIMLAVSAVFALSIPLAANANNDDENPATINTETTFEEIGVSELPENVSEALTKEYSEYTVDKAYRANDGTYKVSVSKDDENLEVYIDGEGELIKVEGPQA